MLINLSNHPKNAWSQNQIDEAEKLYGKIVDLDFPKIPPDADEEIVSILANDFKDICIDILIAAKDKINAVHIMGEHTFMFALTTLLLKNNIKCIASTTERDVSVSDGNKNSRFRFVRFRDYCL